MQYMMMLRGEVCLVDEKIIDTHSEYSWKYGVIVWSE